MQWYHLWYLSHADIGSSFPTSGMQTARTGYFNAYNSYQKNDKKT